MIRALQFVSLHMRNFKGFVGDEPHRLFLGRRPGFYFLGGRNELEPQLGSNGAGKTSIFDAIRWCLHGRTTEDLRNPDIKPWYGEKQSEVGLKVVVSEAAHEIVRTTFPNSLTLDGEEVGQETIDNLIMGADLFAHTIILGQGQPLFFDLGPEAKMQLFSEALTLDRWDVRSDTAKARVQELQREISQRSGRIEGLELAISRGEVNLAKIKKDQADWEASRAGELEAAQKGLAEWQVYKESIDTEYAAASTSFDSAKTELDAYEGKVEEARLALSDAQIARDRTIAKQEADAREIGILEAQIKEVKTARKCPVCGQPVSKTNLAVHLFELEEQLAGLRATAEDPKKGTPRRDSDIVSLTKAYEAAKARGQPLRERAQKAGHAANLILPRVHEADANIASFRREVARWESEANPFSGQRKTLLRQLADDKRDIDEERKALATAQAREQRAAIWVKGFKDVRLYVIEGLLDSLRLTTAANLMEMGLPDWRIDYDIERETKSGSIKRGMSVSILSPYFDKPVRWESYSGGERQRLRVVGAMALSDSLLEYAGISTNFQGLDEPTQHLSIEGVRDICAFLPAKALSAARSIFYVDHQAISSKAVAKTIMVVKDQYGSRIE